MTKRSVLTEFDPIEVIVSNSFKDFHAKGMDYICVKRSPKLTIKYYMFTGFAAEAPEVVAPHNHRYNFYTKVVAGGVANSKYQERAHGRVFNRFQYLTPLNGGDGFTFERETRLLRMSRRVYSRNWTYGMEAHELHTIQITEPETILRLRQYEDVMPLDAPTHTFVVDAVAPSLSGLYSKFTADEVVKRLNQIRTAEAAS